MRAIRRTSQLLGVLLLNLTLAAGCGGQEGEEGKPPTIAPVDVGDTVQSACKPEAKTDGVSGGAIKATVQGGVVTITHEDATLVKCCQLFADLTRRGPALVVLKEDVVVGLISRIDIIRGVLKYLKSAPDRKTRLLYLSALNKMGEETPGRMRDSAGTS